MNKEIRDYSKQYSQAERNWVAHEAMGEQSLSSRRSVLDQFYTEQRNLMQEDEEWTDIRQLAEKHNIIIITAIKPYGQLGSFRPINKREFQYVRLFDALLRENLLASASSLVPGDTRDHMYGSFGVIIGAGKIEDAYHSDVNSWVSEGKMHSRFQQRLSHVRPAEKVQYAIESPRSHYNEINARIEGISGIYFTNEKGSGSNDALPQGKLLNTLISLGIPFYLVKGGEFYRIQDPSNHPESTAGIEPTEPEEIVQTVFKPTTQQREGMIYLLAKNLQLPPRNAVSSGVKRAEFVFAKKIANQSQQRSTVNMKEFIREMELHMLDNPRLSAQIYSAIALFRIGDLVQEAQPDFAQNVYKQASSMITREEYNDLTSRIRETGYLNVIPSDIEIYMETGDLPNYM